VVDPLPKSAHAANSEAKICAAAVAAALEGISFPEPSYVNACYSLLAEDYGISVSGVYRWEAGSVVAVKGSVGTSPLEASAEFRKKEAGFARDWYQSIIADSFALSG
jgi:sulfide dehydrogenase [flavocytochrome c] flavoprotein subunit